VSLELKIMRYQDLVVRGKHNDTTAKNRHVTNMLSWRTNNSNEDDKK